MGTRALTLLLVGAFCLNSSMLYSQVFRMEIPVLYWHFVGSGCVGALAILLYLTQWQRLAYPLRWLCVAQMAWCLGFLQWSDGLLPIAGLAGPAWLVRRAASKEEDGPDSFPERVLSGWLGGALVCVVSPIALGNWIPVGATSLLFAVALNKRRFELVFVLLAMMALVALGMWGYFYFGHSRTIVHPGWR